MTSLTKQYSAAAGRARSAVVMTADLWSQGARTLADRVPGLPRVDLVPAVERYFAFVQRTVDANHSLAVRWAEAASTRSDEVRSKAVSAAEVARDKAESAGDLVRDQADAAERAAVRQARQAERAVREQAEQAELKAAEQARQAAQAEEELAREARRVERQQARQAHRKARERYDGLTKAELSDQLARRGLPKSGNLDELIERLAEADGR